MKMGNNYLIAGATSGIGEACARLLAQEGHTLLLIGRNKEKLNLLTEQLPGKIIPICYDLNDLNNIKKIYDFCSENQVKLDGLVYSAGVDGTWPVKVNPIASMRQMMDVNCFAFVEMSRIFYSKRYSADGAAIVVLSSIASLTNEIGMMSYSASKAALNSVVKTMSKEFVRRRIRVNAILPGGVCTPMAEKKEALLSGVEDEKAENTGQDKIQPLGMIPAEAIAEQVKYLLSDISSYMTGELMVISGGRDYR